MKSITVGKIIVCLIIIISSNNIFCQYTSPDKFINYMKKDDSSIAVTLPGWLVRTAGNLASREMENDEKAILKELTHHIKKLRFVVTENLPSDYKENFSYLKNYMDKNGYEPLIEVVDDGSKIHLWASMDGQTINRIIISVLEPDDQSVFFNIKSNIDLDRLKELNFYKEWKSL